MAGADEVESSLLHQPYLAYFGSIESHCPQYTVVVMDAGAVDEQFLAIEQKALLGIEREGTDAELHMLLAYDTAFRHQANGGLIEVGVFGRP